MPVLFRFTEDGTYEPGWLTYSGHVLKIFLFLSGADFLLCSRRADAGSKKNPHLAVAISGVVMAGMVVLQILHPLLPF